MKRVVLINPGQPGGDPRFSVTEPLNLGDMASYLEKHGVDVRIVDELAGDNVEAEVTELRPDVAGITATTPLAPRAYEIADMCRGMGILTVLGGVHPSVMSEEALEHADIVVKGEGERALLDIVRGEVDSNVMSRPYIKDLDSIGPPARHLMHMDFYVRTKDRVERSFLHFVSPGMKAATILTSRGCPHACTFCHNTWRGMPCRFRSPASVVAEIAELRDKYHVQAVFFIEDNLFMNKARLREICDRLKHSGMDIIWGGNARADGVDAEILATARDAGCRQVTFGFESGSQRILDILCKGTTVEQNAQAARLCKEVGILSNATFIIGVPTETIEDIRATQEFIRSTPIDRPGVCLCTPFPGTELWRQCKEQGLVPDGLSWEDFTFDKVPVPMCRDVSPEELVALFYETDELIHGRAIGLRAIAAWAFRNPLRASAKVAKMLARPSRIPAAWRKAKRGIKEHLLDSQTPDETEAPRSTPDKQCT